MIEFACGCGKSYVVDDALAGKQGKCKECGAALHVPARTGEGKATPGAARGGSKPWDAGPERKLAKLAKKCGAAQVYLMLTSRRFFTGEGTVEFRQGVLCVRGMLGQDPLETLTYWVVVVIIGNFAIAFIPIRAVLLTGPFVFNIACVAYLVFRLLSGREMKTIYARPEKTSSVECKGPVVTITFRAPPVPAVTTIRMFVSERFREEFFLKFDRMFPRALPEDYRAALEGANGAQPEEDEY